MAGTWGGALEPHPLKVRITFTMDTVQAQTGFTLRDTTMTAANPQACAADVADWVEESFRTIFHQVDRFTGVDVLDMVNGNGGSYAFNNVVGSSTAANDVLVPTYVTQVIALKGEIRRRYGQGRMIWPVRTEAGITSQLASTAHMAAVQGVVDNFAARYLGSGSSSDYQLINAHGPIDAKPATPSSPARPAVPPSYQDVTAIQVKNILSFLRSRKVGVGT